MNCKEIQNISGRIVFVRGMSGKTYHLPPGYKHELPEQEITGNVLLKKLQDRKLIAVREISKTATAKPFVKKSRSTKSKPEKVGSKGKPAGMKSRSTKSKS